MIRGIIIEREPFTLDNSKLTSSFKLSRSYMQSFYQSQINDLQEKINQSKENITENENELLDVNEQKSIQESPMSYIIKRLLNKSPHEYSIEKDTFESLGGDSLIAIQLIQLVRRKIGVEIPINLLFDRATPLSRLESFIRSKLTKISENNEEKNNNSPNQSAIDNANKNNDLERTLLDLEMDCKVDDILSQPIIPFDNISLSNHVLLTGIFIFKDLNNNNNK